MVRPGLRLAVLAVASSALVSIPLVNAQQVPSNDSPRSESNTASTKPVDKEHASATSKPMALQSLIPTLPDYKGDLWNRSFLTGDWNGARTELAEHGILFDFDVTQWTQGNAHGGKDTNNAFRYSASADYKIRLDTARMGLWPGGLITLRGETQIGQSINPKVGSMGASNYQALLPVPGDPGETTLSEFYLAQALSEQVVLVAGKMDLSSGDDNEFAHNQRTQFSNLMFRINPVLFPGGPYTTMAAGVLLLPTKWLTVSTFVADNDPNGAANMTGFNTAFTGRNWLSVMQEYDFTWKPFGQTGHQRFGWLFTNRDYIDFNGDPRLQLPAQIVRNGLRSKFDTPRWLRAVRLGNTVVSVGNPERRPDNWGLYYNFDQYVYTKPDDPTQGVGFFGRFGFAPGDCNAIEEFYSAGIGGKGLVSHRPKDQWGVGYYFANTSNDLGSLLNVQAEQGVEAYYNFEITPWLHISPDLQVIVDPGAGFQDRDVALVYGIRVQMTF